MTPKLFVATKAFIEYRSKVLLLRESTKYQEGSNSGRYDVPGGRLSPGEGFMESLRREVREETALEITIGKPFFVNEWLPIIKNEQWQIIGIFFACQAHSDKVILSEDHDSFIWIDSKNYLDHPIISNLEKAFEAYNARHVI